MTDRRNPIHAALTDLAMELLRTEQIDDAITIANALDLYERHREPRKRRNKDHGGAGLQTTATVPPTAPPAAETTAGAPADDDMMIPENLRMRS